MVTFLTGLRSTVSPKRDGPGFGTRSEAQAQDKVRLRYNISCWSKLFVISDGSPAAYDCICTTVFVKLIVCCELNIQKSDVGWRSGRELYTKDIIEIRNGLTKVQCIRFEAVV